MKPCDRYVRSAAAAAIAAVALTPLPCAARQYSPNGGSTLNSYTSPYAGMTQSSRGQKLEVATFNLAPPGVIGENIEQARAVANSTVDVVRTMLYSQGGEQTAAAQGRRMWFDRNTLQLTVTDHPEHIRRVSDYLRSLSAPGSKKRSGIRRTSGGCAPGSPMPPSPSSAGTG